MRYSTIGSVCLLYVATIVFVTVVAPKAYCVCTWMPTVELDTIPSNGETAVLLDTKLWVLLGHGVDEPENNVQLTFDGKVVGSGTSLGREDSWLVFELPELTENTEYQYELTVYYPHEAGAPTHKYGPYSFTVGSEIGRTPFLPIINGVTRIETWTPAIGEQIGPDYVVEPCDEYLALQDCFDVDTIVIYEFDAAELDGSLYSIEVESSGRCEFLNRKYYLPSSCPVQVAIAGCSSDKKGESNSICVKVASITSSGLQSDETRYCYEGGESLVDVDIEEDIKNAGDALAGVESKSKRNSSCSTSFQSPAQDMPIYLACFWLLVTFSLKRLRNGRPTEH